ncbi:hypothetical protein DFJ74DRAFT_710341 [Hyaloraphidium curvatum]|nr:hypothetical protein DFJ74DRAFT_710341 [Hyaloraphidium curvatum]
MDTQTNGSNGAAAAPYGKPGGGEGPGLFHRVAMTFTVPALFVWDQTAFALDFLFASWLWLLGGQVRFGVDLPTPTNHPIVVATGTSTGIGYHCALSLASAGYLVFAGVRKPSDGERLLSAWRSRRAALEARRANLFFRAWDWLAGSEAAGYVEGGEVRWIIVDVARTETVARAAEEVAKQVRDAGQAGVYGVFANAGINAGCAFELETLDEERKTLDVNVFGALETCRAFLPLLRRNGKGRIVVTGSLAGIATAPMAAAYTASKHALYAAADAMRMELAPLGIAVSNMEPGEIETEIWGKQLGLVDHMTSHPLRRIYEGHIRSFAAGLKLVSAFPGTPPSYCAVSLLHTLASPFPLPRYPVGFDSWFGRFVKWFTPDRLWDAWMVAGMRGGMALPETVLQK